MDKNKQHLIDRMKQWFTAPPMRAGLVLAADGLAAALSLWVAMILRFEGRITDWYARVLPLFIITLVLARIVVNSLLRLHRWSFRFSGLSDAARVVAAGALGSGVFLSLMYFYMVSRSHVFIAPPRSVIVMEFFLSTAFMGLLRFSPRLAGIYLADRTRSRGGAMRTLIIGAGAEGDSLLRDLRRSESHNYHVVGFVDDDRSKRGIVLGGRRVLGGIDDLPLLAKKYQIEEVLIAIPRLKALRIREILSMCADLKLRFKILPLSFLQVKEKAPASMLQELTPEDLLPRDPVSFANGRLSSEASGKTVLVTGAGGSIGSEICRQLMAAGAGRLVMVDLNENELYLLQRRLEAQFNGRTILAEVADIRDTGRINTLFSTYHPEHVFHAAAHKHVPLMEVAPGEAVKNNIFGTRGVALAAHANGAQRFCLISTDKAVRPSSVMGVSKRVAELLVRDLARRSSTRFCAVRFGNVLGSAGSVVPLFKEQIARGGPVTITHPDVRRYFMTITEAVGLVLEAVYGDYGGLCVLDMGEQIRIQDLARNMITMAGLVPEADVALVYTGLRPGEKLSEELLTEAEEKTVRVTGKILVAQVPPPPEDLAQLVGQLEVAAASEDNTATITLLGKLVPSYQKPPSVDPPKNH